MSKMLRSYYDFLGGLNTDAALDNLADNELVQADNVDLVERGGLMKRKGTRRLNETPYTGEVEQIFELPRSDGEVWLMAVIETPTGHVLYRVLEDEGYQLEQVSPVASPQIGYVSFPNPSPEGVDLLYFVDGERYRGFDGESVVDVEDMEPPAPSEPPSAGPDGSDTPTGITGGVYKLGVSFLTKRASFTESGPTFGSSMLREFITGKNKALNIMFAESPVSIIKEVEAEDGDEIKWTNIPTGPPGTVGRVLYRSLPNSDDMKAITTIYDNTTTEYVDRLPDKVIEENKPPKVEEVNDLGPVAKCTMLEWHLNSYRFFAAGNPDDPSALYYSEPGEPDHFKPTSVLYPTTGDGPVTGLAAFGDALLVFYKHSIWAWRGVDPEQDATWHKLPTGVGTESARTVQLTPNSVSFLGPSGVYSVSSGVLGFDVTVEPTEGMVYNHAKNKVEKILRGIERPDLARAVFDSERQRYLLSYTDEGGTRNNRILVLDWNIGAFTRYTNLFANDLLVRLDGSLLMATNGYIVRMCEGCDDHDQPIEMVVRTKNFNLDHPFHKKNLLRLYVSFRQPEQGTSEITLRLHVDDILREEIIEAALYENFVWGESDWGDIWGFRHNVTTRTRIYGSGHRVQMEFVNAQPGDPTTIYGLAFEFRPKRAKGRLL